MRVIALVVILGTATGWQSPAPPGIVELKPSSGPPGTIVRVVGSGLSGASVKWDGTVIPSGHLSAKFFTVPGGAVGGHTVQLKRGSSHSATKTFTVTSKFKRGEPRLDDVTIAEFSIHNGSAGFFLLAHGANIDVGAKILIDGAAVPTTFYSVTRKPMHAKLPELKMKKYVRC